MLDIALQHHGDVFADICRLVRTAIFCRAAPIQKAQVRDTFSCFGTKAAALFIHRDCKCLRCAMGFYLFVPFCLVVGAFDVATTWFVLAATFRSPDLPSTQWGSRDWRYLCPPQSARLCFSDTIRKRREFPGTAVAAYPSGIFSEEFHD